MGGAGIGRGQPLVQPVLRALGLGEWNIEAEPPQPRRADEHEQGRLARTTRLEVTEACLYELHAGKMRKVAH